MAIRSATVTREYIEAAPLPVHGQTYTIISHKFVIEETLKALAANGFEIDKELYRCNRGADIAQGIYHLKYDGDPEMGLMFTWANSYDKSMRFRCSTGSYVYSSENRLIAGARSRDNWSRKHTGTADQQAQRMITRYIANAAAYYKELIETRDQMKLITVPLQTRAEIMGRFFFEKNALSGEQMLIVKDQFRNSKFDYNTTPESLWTMYNHIAYSLQKSHPRKWMDQQTTIHWFLCDFFNISDKIEAPVIVDATDVPVVEDPVLETSADEVPAAEPEVEVVAAEVDSVEIIGSGTQPDVTAEVKEAEPDGAELLSLESWMLSECKSMGVSIDKESRFLFFKEGQEVPESLFNATVELGWTIQPSLPFPVEEN